MKTIFLALVSLMLFGSGLAYAGDYTSSAHGNSTDGVSGRLSGYGIGNCAHCHEQHASVGGTEGTPEEYLLFQDYKNTSYNAFCTDKCHRAVDSWGGDDIESQYAKTYHHPTTGPHTPGESNPGDFSGSNEHAYCIDCHNPHVAKKIDRTVGSNSVSGGPLLKVSGVSVIHSAAAWDDDVPSYTFIPASPGIEYEYQLCYKCHSNWTGPNDPVVRDTAKEFNPANASFHPVELSLGASGSGSTALTPAQMNDDWQNVGDQTMYCSDCHGDSADDTTSGPHGSSSPAILKGYLWPLRPNDEYWTQRDARFNLNSFNEKCLCKKCHTIRPKLEQHPAHGTRYHGAYGFQCVSCHVGLPHGSHFGRLILERGMGHPYHHYDPLQPWSGGCIEDFIKKTPATGYGIRHCQATCAYNHLGAVY